MPALSQLPYAVKTSKKTAQPLFHGIFDVNGLAYHAQPL